MRARLSFRSVSNPPVGWLDPRRLRPLLVALLFGAIPVVAAGEAHAGTISAVSPAGASADATIRITGTGFSTTAAQHDVVFTAGAVERHATPTGVSTVDTASGLRTLTVRVPAGLPVGPVGIRVVNLASGETSAGAGFEHVALALPDPVAAPPGTTQTVSIGGSANAQFAAGSTRVTFGAGITVTGVTVIDARALRATIAIAATAAPGPRTVGVITSTQTLVLTGGFTVLAAGAPPNRAPTAVPNGPYGGEVGQGLAFSSAGSADPDGDALTYRWDFGDGAVSTDPNPSHVYAAAGTFPVTLVVTDTRGASASATTTAAITAPAPTNQPPSVSAGAAQTVTLPASAALAGSATDDGLPTPPGMLTLAWTMVSGPAGGTVTFTPPDAAATTASFTVAGDYVLRLTASDGALSASADVAVTVNPAPPTDAIPPTVTLSAPREILPGAEITVTATAVDNDRVVAVRFEVDDLPPTESPAEPYQRTFTVPAFAVPGRTIGVRAVARDPAGNTGRADALVTIADAPDTEAPVVALAAPPQTAPGARIRLVATATDNVGVAGVVFLVDGREVASDAVAPYEATWDVPPDAPVGTTLALTARATDFAGLTGEGRASTLVAAAGETLPVVSLAVPAEVVAGQRVTLSAAASDGRVPGGRAPAVRGRAAAPLRPPFPSRRPFRSLASA